jgi:hypothetical protein
MTDKEILIKFLEDSGYEPCPDHMPCKWSPPSDNKGLDFPYIDTNQVETISEFWGSHG